LSNAARRGTRSRTIYRSMRKGELSREYRVGKKVRGEKWTTYVL
jgi:hypothetical protein